MSKGAVQHHGFFEWSSLHQYISRRQSHFDANTMKYCLRESNQGPSKI